MTSASTHSTTSAATEAPKPVRTAAASQRLTLSEVAERLNMCTRSIQKLVKAGRFPRGVHLGRDVCWLESVVDQWLEAKFSEQMAWEPKKKRTDANKAKPNAQVT